MLNADRVKDPEYAHRKIDKGQTITLVDQVRMWQTPVADDAVDRAKGKYNSRGEPKLSAQVRMWPTPQSRDHFPPHTPEYIEAKRAQGHGMSNLNDAVGDRLNPDWVEWLMGWPIGWTALDPLPVSNWQAWRDGNSWAADPADDGSVPRVSGKTPNRVARLKAIGNGQVPDCLALAWCGAMAVAGFADWVMEDM